MQTNRNHVNQNRGANFWSDGQFYLLRCYACPDTGDYGRENYAMAVATGSCVWCGWSQDKDGQQTSTDCDKQGLQG